MFVDCAISMEVRGRFLTPELHKNC